MGDKTKAVRAYKVIGFLAVLFLICPHKAYANPVSAITKVVGGILQVPVSIIVGTVSGPPIVGTLLGAVNGTLHGVGMVASGLLELGMDGVGLAKMAAPYVLPFVL